MPDMTVKARVASTRPLEKYGGFRATRELLEHMTAALNRGDVPLVVDHAGDRVIERRNVHAEVIHTGDGEYAVDVTFDVDSEDWQAAQEAGATRGFSYAFGQVQVASPGEPVVSLAADAAGFSDEERQVAWQALDAVAPASVSRLYQFAAPEALRIIVDIGMGVAGNAIFYGILALIRRRSEESTIEIRRHHADGSTTTTVIRTKDAHVLRTALDELDAQDQ